MKPKYKRLIMEQTHSIQGKSILQTSKKNYTIIEDVPVPSLILWDNLGKGKGKILRGIVSWFISLFLLLATYVLTAYFLYIRNSTTVSKYDFTI